jgi:ribosomal peptide maturation radical SAM protein 1
MKQRVALINMPFADINCPALGLSTLKAALTRQGVACRIHYTNLWLAERLDYELAMRLIDGWPNSSVLAAEWIFSAALHGEDSRRDNDYIESVLKPAIRHHELNWSEAQIEQETVRLFECRRTVEPFIERCLSEIPWGDYRIVGFSSLFQQRMAAQTLARRLRERYPHLFIIFGGANCEGPMGAATLRTADYVDAVCSGEGDVVFPLLVERILAGRPVGTLPGILWRDPNTLQELKLKAPSDPEVTVAPPVKAMDELPYPDFDEYFDGISTAVLSEPVTPCLLIETSRGCWWGQKAHCTFCGLNGSTMAFRQKSAERALAELTSLLDRYGSRTRSVCAVDNIIPFEYMKTFLPKLRDLSLDIRLFYETKSNLLKEHLELFSEVGLTSIQPGIESLSTPVLKLMRKGVTGIQNVQLLKWCLQFGIRPSWNYLIGFPGEQPEHFDGQSDLIRTLFHLPPPETWGRVRFDRFSPYLTQPAELGVANLRPYPAYRFIYPDVSERDLFDLAYYFTGEFEGDHMIEENTRALRAALEEWRSAHEDASLFSIPSGDQLIICDLREKTTPEALALTGLPRTMIEVCDSICSRAALGKRLAAAGSDAAPDRIDEVVGALMRRRLLIREEHSYLSVVVPVGSRYSPSKRALDRLAALL